MIDKKTVFVLGAGASCPYGYPSGARLRERICLSEGFWKDYQGCPQLLQESVRLHEIEEFKDRFNKSRIKSIDLFMANKSELSSIGKYIIAFEILRAEGRSRFGEEAQQLRQQIEDRERFGKGAVSDRLSLPLFQGGDWYSYLYNRLMEDAVGKEYPSDFSDGNLSFITFNYDRSLEHFLYEGFWNSFEGDLRDEVLDRLRQLRILHVYGQVAPLKWQDPKEGVDYHPQISESLLRSAAENIKTIYEGKESAELVEAHELIESAHRIIFLGFGYSEENMAVLNLPDLIVGGCEVRGTALNMIEEQVKRIRDTILLRRRGDGSSYSGSYDTRIEPCDCLMLLRKYL